MGILYNKLLELRQAVTLKGYSEYVDSLVEALGEKKVISKQGSWLIILHSYERRFRFDNVIKQKQNSNP